MPWGIAAAVAGSVVSSALAPSPQQPQASSGGGGGSGFAGLLSSYMTQEQAKAMQGATTQATAMADPFAQSRQMANTQLQSLMQNPGQMQNDPSYQFSLQQGQQALDRSLAAKHQTASGNALTEITQYGQGLASQQYNNRLNQLSNMASQGASPTGAASALMAGTQLSQGLSSAAGTGAMSSLGGLASGAGTALGGIGGSISNAIQGYSQPTGALPQYSTGGFGNQTGFDTGIGGSGYTVASTGGYGSQQSQMLASQW